MKININCVIKTRVSNDDDLAQFSYELSEIMDEHDLESI